MDLKVILRVRQPDRPFLNSGLQRHGTAGKFAELLQLFILQIPDAEDIVGPQLALVLPPPDLR